MKSKKNRKLFQRPFKVLNGYRGIVYLMFLGRDTYAAKIQNSLVGTIYKKNSSVNQTVQRLLEHGSEFLIFQRKHREEGVPGRKAEIYTASFDPIFQTLQAFNINFDEDELQLALKLLSPANDAFPQYLNSLFEKSILRNASWHLILSNYFAYMSELIRTSIFSDTSQETPHSLLPAGVSIPREEIHSLLSKYSGLAKKFIAVSVRMSLTGVGLQPELISFLLEALPSIDQKLFEKISELQDDVSRFFAEREKDRQLAKDLKKTLREFTGTKDMKSTMEYIEKLRETEEFLNWKLAKEKKKES